MKKFLLYFTALCLVACNGNAPEGGDDEFVDLGLDSGTKWKIQNEENTNDYYDLFDYETAISEFGSNLPTADQWEELRINCHWEWTGSEYEVTGPNGKTIVLPATGKRECSTGNVIGVGEKGYYWSSASLGLDDAWFQFFDSRTMYLDYSSSCYGLAVRLVR
jgi:hypothetical protein